MCIYSYIFKLKAPSKYSPFDTIHLLRFFPTAQNSFWTHRFWCLLEPLQFFISPLLHLQNIFLWGLFSSRETKVTWGEMGWTGRVGHGDHAIFWSKTVECSALVWADALVNHPSWHGKRVERVFKKIHWSQTQRVTAVPPGPLILMGS